MFDSTLYYTHLGRDKFYNRKSILCSVFIYFSYFRTRWGLESCGSRTSPTRIVAIFKRCHNFRRCKSGSLFGRKLIFCNVDETGGGERPQMSCGETHHRPQTLHTNSNRINTAKMHCTMPDRKNERGIKKNSEQTTNFSIQQRLDVRFLREKLKYRKIALCKTNDGTIRDKRGRPFVWLQTLRSTIRKSFDRPSGSSPIQLLVWKVDDRYVHLQLESYYYFLAIKLKYKLWRFAHIIWNLFKSTYITCTIYFKTRTYNIWACFMKHFSTCTCTWLIQWYAHRT